jgi:poly(3-hydroxybutyrate) depolymerase
MMHGTADTAIGYDGTSGGLCPCASVADDVAFWLEADSGRGPSSSVTDGSVTTTSTAACHANSDVVLVTIENGEPVWPSIGTDVA